MSVTGRREVTICHITDKKSGIFQLEKAASITERWTLPLSHLAQYSHLH